MAESNGYFPNAFMLENEWRRWVCLIFTILYSYLEKKKGDQKDLLVLFSK